MTKRLDLTGKQFGRLTATTFSKSGGSAWDCKCSCGNIKTVRTNHLRSGATKSCGCLSTELSINRSRTHGCSSEGAYKTWVSMNNRCTNKKNEAYKYYGEKGIKICSEWGNYLVFKKDMGARPKDHTIERVDNNKGYNKYNCKWIHKRIQTRNKSNVYLTEEIAEYIRKWKDKYNISYFADKYNVSVCTIRDIIKNRTWNITKEVYNDSSK